MIWFVDITSVESLQLSSQAGEGMVYIQYSVAKAGVLGINAILIFNIR
jgi:hypothetical protein